MPLSSAFSRRRNRHKSAAPRMHGNDGDVRPLTTSTAFTSAAVGEASRTKAVYDDDGLNIVSQLNPDSDDGRSRRSRSSWLGSWFGQPDRQTLAPPNKQTDIAAMHGFDAMRISPDNAESRSLSTTNDDLAVFEMVVHCCLNDHVSMLNDVLEQFSANKSSEDASIAVIENESDVEQTSSTDGEDERVDNGGASVRARTAKTTRKYIGRYLSRRATDGHTPLTLCVDRDSYQCFSILAKYGVDTNLCTSAVHGCKTALLLAVELCRHDYVRPLLLSGANPSLSDIDGRSALSVAAERDDTVFHEMLSNTQSEVRERKRRRFASNVKLFRQACLANDTAEARKRLCRFRTAQEIVDAKSDVFNDVVVSPNAFEVIQEVFTSLPPKEFSRTKQTSSCASFDASTLAVNPLRLAMNQQHQQSTTQLFSLLLERWPKLLQNCTQTPSVRLGSVTGDSELGARSLQDPTPVFHAVCIERHQVAIQALLRASTQFAEQQQPVTEDAEAVRTFRCSAGEYAAAFDCNAASPVLGYPEPLTPLVVCLQTRAHEVLETLLRYRAPVVRRRGKLLTISNRESICPFDLNVVAPMSRELQPNFKSSSEEIDVEEQHALVYCARKILLTMIIKCCGIDIIRESCRRNPNLSTELHVTLLRCLVQSSTACGTKPSTKTSRRGKTVPTRTIADVLAELQVLATATEHDCHILRNSTLRAGCAAILMSAGNKEVLDVDKLAHVRRVLAGIAWVVKHMTREQPDCDEKCAIRREIDLADLTLTSVDLSKVDLSVMPFYFNRESGHASVRRELVPLSENVRYLFPMPTCLKRRSLAGPVNLSANAGLMLEDWIASAVLALNGHLDKIKSGGTGVPTMTAVFRFPRTISPLLFELVTSINLNDTRLHDFPTSLLFLPNLVDLSLADNSLTNLPGCEQVFAEFKRMIDYEDCLQADSGGFNVVRMFWSHLAKLDVSRNKLVSVPCWIFHLPRIRLVAAVHNLLCNLPTCLWRSTVIRELRVERNLNLATLPWVYDAQTRCRLLIARDVAYDRVTVTHPLQNETTRMTDRTVSGIIHEIVEDADPMAELYVNQRESLEVVPFVRPFTAQKSNGRSLLAPAGSWQSRITPKLHGLATLKIAGTGITRLPDNLACLAPFMTSLDANGCAITTFPALNRLPPLLEDLSLASNQISTINLRFEDDSGGCPCSHNVNSVSSHFSIKKLSRLERINLASNPLTDVKVQFDKTSRLAPLPKLSSLLLNNTLISSVPVELKQRLAPRLSELVCNNCQNLSHLPAELLHLDNDPARMDHFVEYSPAMRRKLSDRRCHMLMFGPIRHLQLCQQIFKAKQQSSTSGCDDLIAVRDIDDADERFLSSFQIKLKQAADGEHSVQMDVIQLAMTYGAGLLKCLVREAKLQRHVVLIDVTKDEIDVQTSSAIEWCRLVVEQQRLATNSLGSALSPTFIFLSDKADASIKEGRIAVIIAQLKAIMSLPVDADLPSYVIPIDTSSSSISSSTANKLTQALAAPVADSLSTPAASSSSNTRAETLVELARSVLRTQLSLYRISPTSVPTLTSPQLLNSQSSTPSVLFCEFAVSASLFVEKLGLLPNLKDADAAVVLHRLDQEGFIIYQPMVGLKDYVFPQPYATARKLLTNLMVPFDGLSVSELDDLYRSTGLGLPRDAFCRFMVNSDMLIPVETVVGLRYFSANQDIDCLIGGSPTERPSESASTMDECQVDHCQCCVCTTSPMDAKSSPVTVSGAISPQKRLKDSEDGSKKLSEEIDQSLAELYGIDEGQPSFGSHDNRVNTLTANLNQEIRRFYSVVGGFSKHFFVQLASSILSNRALVDIYMTLCSKLASVPNVSAAVPQPSQPDLKANVTEGGEHIKIDMCGHGELFEISLLPKSMSSRLQRHTWRVDAELDDCEEKIYCAATDYVCLDVRLPKLAAELLEGLDGDRLTAVYQCRVAILRELTLAVEKCLRFNFRPDSLGSKAAVSREAPCTLCLKDLTDEKVNGGITEANGDVSTEDDDDAFCKIPDPIICFPLDELFVIAATHCSSLSLDALHCDRHLDVPIMSNLLNIGKCGAQRSMCIAPDLLWLDLHGKRLLPASSVMVRSTKLLGRGGMGYVYAGRLDSKGGMKCVKWNEGNSLVAVKTSVQAGSSGGNRKVSLNVWWMELWALRSEVEMMMTPGLADAHRGMPVRAIIVRPASFVMPLFNEGSLSGKLDQLRFARMRLPAFSLLYVVYQMAAALAFLHSRNLAYLDLKSENVLVEEMPPFDMLPDGMTIPAGARIASTQLPSRFRIRLSDFGLAKRTDCGPLRLAVGAAGTRGFMAPECTDADEPFDATAADVHTLAMFAYELVTCKQPFTDHDNRLIKFRPASRPRLSMADTYYPFWLLEMLPAGWNLDPRKRPTANAALLLTGSQDAIGVMNVDYLDVREVVSGDSPLEAKVATTKKTVNTLPMAKVLVERCHASTLYGSDAAATQVSASFSNETPNFGELWLHCTDTKSYCVRFDLSPYSATPVCPRAVFRPSINGNIVAKVHVDANLVICATDFDESVYLLRFDEQESKSGYDADAVYSVTVIDSLRRRCQKVVCLAQNQATSVVSSPSDREVRTTVLCALYDDQHMAIFDWNFTRQRPSIKRIVMLNVAVEHRIFTPSLAVIMSPSRTGPSGQYELWAELKYVRRAGAEAPPNPSTLASATYRIPFHTKTSVPGTERVALDVAELPFVACPSAGGRKKKNFAHKFFQKMTAGSVGVAGANSGDVKDNNTIDDATDEVLHDPTQCDLMCSNGVSVYRAHNRRVAAGGPVVYKWDVESRVVRRSFRLLPADEEAKHDRRALVAHWKLSTLVRSWEDVMAGPTAGYSSVFTTRNGCAPGDELMVSTMTCVGSKYLLLGTNCGLVMVLCAAKLQVLRTMKLFLGPVVAVLQHSRSFIPDDAFVPNADASHEEKAKKARLFTVGLAPHIVTVAGCGFYNALETRKAVDSKLAMVTLHLDLLLQPSVSDVIRWHNATH